MASQKTSNLVVAKSTKLAGNPQKAIF